jgi:hypothetical protein
VLAALNRPSAKLLRFLFNDSPEPVAAQLKKATPDAGLKRPAKRQKID